MLGIVGVLGLDHPFTSDEQPVPAPVTPTAMSPVPPPIQVVVHRIPASTVVPSEPIPEIAETTLTETPTSAPVEAVVSAAPIVLTANPVVQTVTVAAPSQASAPAPAATTHGSK
jgi:hypothetical protein